MTVSQSSQVTASGPAIRAAVGLLLALAPPSAHAAGDPVPVSAALRQAIRDDLQGQVALDHVWQLTTFDRTTTTEGYHQAMEYVQRAADAAGLEEVEVIRFPADGTSRILDTYQASWGWRIGGGSLSYAETGRPICRYLDVPTCIVKQSSGVDVVADLVDVGTGLADEDWAGKKVEGKLVLASSPASAVFAYAEDRYPILGVVSHWGNYLPDRSPFPDQVAWQAIPQSLDPKHFAFSVSARMAAELQRQLASGPVGLHAQIDAEILPGEYEILTGVIRGREQADEELLVVAHLNHYRPGANDNASGSALSLELATVLRRLIERGLLAPRRTIRFLWVPEHRGTQIFLHLHRDWGERGIAVIDNDMVGANQAESGSIFLLTRTPDFRPSYLNDLMASLLDEMAREQYRSRWGSRNPFHYRQVAYSGVISDHAHFVDSTVGVAAVMLSTDPDNFYHSNEDTADHIDATTLMRAGYVTAAAVSYLADAGPSESMSIAELVGGAAAGRIGSTLAEGLLRLEAASDPTTVFAEEDNRLRHRGETEVQAIESVRRLGSSPANDKRIGWLVAAVREQIATSRTLLHSTHEEKAATAGQEPPSAPAGDSVSANRIPVRRVFGPLRFAFLLDALPAQRRDWYERGPLDALRREAILNYVDGQRTVAEIRNEVAGELGMTDLESVHHYLEDLVSVGLMAWRKPNGDAPP